MGDQTQVDVKAQALAEIELWVKDTAVVISKDPESGARQMQALYGKIRELEGLQRLTNLRLATADDLPGATRVTWSTGPSVMGVRLILEGALFNGSKDVVQARILRSKKGKFRVQTLVDEYRRGLLMGKHEAVGTAPTIEEYQALNRDYCVTGDLAQAVIRFCQAENLVPALKAGGHGEAAEWFKPTEAKPEEKAPEPRFDG